MIPGPVDTAALDRILRQTVRSLEQGKEELFAIAESARQERDRVGRELERVREEARRVVDEVDRWQQEDRRARRRLAEVSKDFARYSEDDIRRAYDEAREVQVKLVVLREREKQLLARRKDLELSYRQLEETQARAERLVTHVGVAMDFLGRSLQQIWCSAEQVQEEPRSALAVITAQEEERRRIARGIHDGPAQHLARLVMQAEYCEKLWETRPQDLPPELGLLKEQARASLAEIRKIIFDLSPVDLGGGIVRAVERYLADFRERTGLPVVLEVRGSRPSYAPQHEITVFRIIQEALNNVYKHAAARAVKVTLENQPHFIRATIEDDGCGFIVDEVPWGETFGLTSMREWAGLVQGELEIRSQPGQGTRVSVGIKV